LTDSTKSKTVELTVFNGGARSEDEIKVQLSPAFSYSIIAANTSGLYVDREGVLVIGRLTPKQDATVILSAEGGEFRKDHVIGISSKETSGRIKEKLQDAQLTPAQNALIALVMFVLLPAIGYGLGKMIEEVWPKTLTAGVVESSVEFLVDNRRLDPINATKATIQTYDETLKVSAVSRRGDLVSISLELKNGTKDRLDYSVFSSTNVSEGRDEHISDIDHIVTDVLVFPGSKKTIKIVDYLPIGSDPNLVGLQIIVDGPNGRGDVHLDVVLRETGPAKG
jgi:hypothetical protein